MATEGTGAREAGTLASGPRYDETFPTLSAAEIERMRRFGAVHRYSDC